MKLFTILVNLINMSQNKKNKIPRYRKHQWFIKSSLMILTILVDITWVYCVAVLNDYASFNKWIFLTINVLVLLLLVRINWLSFRNIVTRRISVMKKLIVTCLLMGAVGGFGTYYLFKLDTNVTKITGGGNENHNASSSSFVVADSDIVTLDNLNNGKIGVMQDNSQNSVAKQVLASANVEATFTLFEDYPSLIEALSSGEVQAAVLPTDFKTQFASVDAIVADLNGLSDIGVISLDNTVESTNSTTINGNNIDLTTTPFTVLLAGIDDGRSDALMLASFNPVSLRLTLTSIPRDAYVPIACYVGGAKDKINAARAVSRDCMVNTVESLLGVEIDFYFESNFNGIVEIVDALGGITINSPVEFDAQNSDAERGHYTEHIFKGEQRVDGEGALAFARERYAFPAGDFQRQQNQQQVIQAILMEAMRMNDLNTMVNLLDAAGNNVSTNLSVDQLVGLFNYIMKKANRFPSQEHIEKMIDIVNSRVTAYNSFLWDEGNYQTVSIVVLWDGSIKAVSELINRNLDLDSELSENYLQVFDASIDYSQPIISWDEYPETKFEPTLTESYYCYVDNGVWENGTCTCPGGTYVAGQGCQAVSVPTQIEGSDQSSCNANGGLFVWSAGTCYTSCPSGTSADGIGGCVGG